MIKQLLGIQLNHVLENIQNIENRGNQYMSLFSFTAVKQAMKKLHWRSQAEIQGAFKMVDFQSIICRRWVLGVA